MAFVPADRVKVSITTLGTVDFGLGAAVTPAFNDFITAGIPDGSLVAYSAYNNSQFETGRGTYNSGTSTLSRDRVFSSSAAGAHTDFTASPVLIVSFLAENSYDILAHSTAASAGTLNTDDMVIPPECIVVGGLSEGGDGSVYEQGSAAGDETLASATISGNSTGWQGYTLVVVIATSAFAAVTHKRKVRVTFTSSSATDFKLIAANIGHVGASGNPYDFASAVPLKDASGNTSITVPANGTATMTADFFFQPGKNLAIDFYTDVAGSDAIAQGAVLGWTSYYTGANEVGLLTKLAGYTPVPNWSYLVSKVEILAGDDSFTTADGQRYEEAFGSKTAGGFGRQLNETNSVFDARPAIMSGGFPAGRVWYGEDHGMRGDFLSGGGYNSPFTDNAPPWADLIAKVRPGDTIVLPGGNNFDFHYSICGFNSKPAILPFATRLVGRGFWSGLAKNYTPSGGATSDEIFLECSDHGNVELNGILLYQNGAGGTAFGCVAPDTSADLLHVVINRMLVTGLGANTWRNGVVIDGTNGPVHYGARDYHIDKLEIANSGGFGLKLAGCEGSGYLADVLIIPLGAPTDKSIWITGNANNSTALMSACIRGGGSLVIEFSSSLNIVTSAQSSVSIDANSSGIMMTMTDLTIVPPTILGTNCTVQVGSKIYP